MAILRFGKGPEILVRPGAGHNFVDVREVARAEKIFTASASGIETIVGSRPDTKGVEQHLPTMTREIGIIYPWYAEPLLLEGSESGIASGKFRIAGGEFLDTILSHTNKGRLSLLSIVGIERVTQEGGVSVLHADPTQLRIFRREDSIDIKVPGFHLAVVRESVNDRLKHETTVVMCPRYVEPAGHYLPITMRTISGRFDGKPVVFLGDGREDKTIPFSLIGTEHTGPIESNMIAGC